MTSTEKLIGQIERVLQKFPDVARTWSTDRAYSGFMDRVGYSALRVECVALGKFIYGQNHAIAREINNAMHLETLHHFETVEGLLKGSIETLKHGLLSELRTQVLLDIKNDFIAAGIEALEGGSKDVAAVLASTVLEDSVKRLADKSDVKEAKDKEFSVAVVALFTAEVITKGTKGILLGYKDLRNAALHAQWAHVSEDAVRGLLQYLPQFMEEHGV